MQSGSTWDHPRIAVLVIWFPKRITLFGHLNSFNTSDFNIGNLISARLLHINVCPFILMLLFSGKAISAYYWCMATLGVWDSQPNQITETVHCWPIPNHIADNKNGCSFKHSDNLILWQLCIPIPYFLPWNAVSMAYPIKYNTYTKYWHSINTSTHALIYSLHKTSFLYIEIYMSSVSVYWNSLYKPSRHWK